MSKKSFKNNPALHFITQPEAEPKAAAPAPKRASRPPAPPVPMKPNPLYIETKSKRVQLLMQPGLYARLKAAAEGSGQSVNNLIHTVLAEWAEKK